MPKYQITASFNLGTEIEPEGVNFDRYAYDQFEDFSDDSSFYRESVTSDGGSLSFTVEAEDEDRAREKVDEVISDQMEVEDSNSFTWMVEDLDIEVEQIEEEMTKERAVEIIQAFLETLVRDGRLDAEVKEAMEFLLVEVTK